MDHPYMLGVLLYQDLVILLRLIQLLDLRYFYFETSEEADEWNDEVLENIEVNQFITIQE